LVVHDIVVLLAPVVGTLPDAEQVPPSHRLPGRARERVQSSGFMVQSSEFMVYGLGFRVRSSGFRGQALGVRVASVQGSGFRVWGKGLPGVFKAHILLYYSTVGSRVIKKKRRVAWSDSRS